MRIAVLADIHGNFLALDAVIRDLNETCPDLVVNLGDHLSGPLWARETADLLMAQTGWMQIRGNHDRQLTTQAAEAMGKSDLAAFQQLSSVHLDWLASLKPVTTITDAVFACHGTPSSDSDYLLEDVSSGVAHIVSADELRRRIGDRTGTLLCGHSHLPRLIRAHENTTVLNPGSVGLPAYDDVRDGCPHVMEAGSPHARYGLMDRGHGAWKFTMRAIEYDWEEASRLAENGGRRDWAHALRTGFALRE